MQPASTPQGDRMPTILLVDDEPMLLAMMELALRQEGLSAITARNAEEALAAARSFAGTIDLLVTDVRLPEEDGTALAETLLAGHPAMRVLFLSGALEEPALQQSGQFEFLAKPFSLNTFVSDVRRLLHSHAAPVN
jgi:DNA-binding NtrC family response regulator